MRILVTNDDGYEAPGLAALVEMAEAFGEVTVVAPSTEQSYAGHRVTVGTTLVPVAYGPGRFHLNGTPADCVRIALLAMPLEVDLVLAGINRGGNLGADIYSSGTVAAAREAALHGRPAIAISQYVHNPHPVDWALTRTHAELGVAAIREEALRGGGAYWNVNLPHPATARGVVRCEPDANPLDVRYEAEAGGFRFAGRYARRPRAAGRDVAHCFAGYVTVSRLTL
jgi:5'-nucleotidase